MTDPISAAAGAATILDRLSAAVRWLLRRPGEQPQLPGRYPHTGLEIRPINFVVDLRRPQPCIEINLYAVNYLRTQLTLTELKVTRFHTNDGPLLEHIYLVQEFRIRPRSSQAVCCRRHLMDSEIPASSQGPPSRLRWIRPANDESRRADDPVALHPTRDSVQTTRGGSPTAHATVHAVDAHVPTVEGSMRTIDVSVHTTDGNGRFASAKGIAATR